MLPKLDTALRRSPQFKYCFICLVKAICCVLPSLHSYCFILSQNLLVYHCGIKEPELVQVNESLGRVKMAREKLSEADKQAIVHSLLCGERKRSIATTLGGKRLEMDIKSTACMEDWEISHLRMSSSIQLGRDMRCTRTDLSPLSRKTKSAWSGCSVNALNSVSGLFMCQDLQDVCVSD